MKLAMTDARRAIMETAILKNDTSAHLGML